MKSFRSKKYPSIGVARKQSGFEFNRENIMEKKVSENHPSSADTLQTAIKEILVIEILPAN